MEEGKIQDYCKKKKKKKKDITHLMQIFKIEGYERRGNNKGRDRVFFL